MLLVSSVGSIGMAHACLSVPGTGEPISKPAGRAQDAERAYRPSSQSPPDKVEARAAATTEMATEREAPQLGIPHRPGR
jgi:hypothetical protein